MIQPINAVSSQAKFRGSIAAREKAPKGLANKNIALINAGGIAAASGGLGTAIARSHTSSWAQAAVLGVCAALSTLFFMAPQIIENAEKAGVQKKAKVTPKLTAEVESPTFTNAIKDYLRPVKKMVQFKQQN